MANTNQKALKVAVVGAGAIGSYFGARLIEGGADVNLVARGAHLAAIREHGMKVLSPLGNVTIQPTKATDNSSDIGPVDIVLFTVKLYDTEAAGAALGPLINDDTAVISLQNGIDAPERLSDLVGSRHVMGGVAYIGAGIEKPGIIRHGTKFARIVFGELDGRDSARAKSFLAACQAAGIDATLSYDVSAELWRKFVFLGGLSAVCSLARMPVGPVRDDPGTRTVLIDAMREIEAVACAKSVELEADIVDRQMAIVDAAAPETKPSLLQDLEAGRRLEIEFLSGAVARLGATLGVDTPFHCTAYGILKLFASGGSVEIR